MTPRIAEAPVAGGEDAACRRDPRRRGSVLREGPRRSRRSTAVPFRVRFEYLVPAGLLYLLAHCCWGTFWVRLLRGQNIPVTLFTGLRCYFVSQFGKYVPGKAWVILLRVGMLGSPGHATGGRGDRDVRDALTSMAAGTLLGIALAAVSRRPAGRACRATSHCSVGLAGLPVALGLLNKLAARVAAKRRGPDAPPLPAPPCFCWHRDSCTACAGGVCWD